MKNYILEVCVDTLESALNAIEGGANRIELCGNLIIGGTSAQTVLYKQIREKSDIKIHAMVRPRFGDFLYTDSEMEIMLHETSQWRELGADGIVCGILTPDGELDVPRMKLIRAAAGSKMNFTMHRAFDVAKDPFATLDAAHAAGVTAILTSGQQPEVLEGKELIRQLVERSNGIQIIPGNGIEENNVAELRQHSKATAYHLSGNIVKQSPMVFRRESIYMGIPGMSEFERWECDSSAISGVKKILEEVE